MPTGPPPSERVVRSVAAHADTDPPELPPLYDTVDPGALDALVDGIEDGTVQFRYAGFSVTVRGDGTVDVTDDRGSGPNRSGAATDD